jgi:hypothetical protein
MDGITLVSNSSVLEAACLDVGLFLPATLWIN